MRVKPAGQFQCLGFAQPPLQEDAEQLAHVHQGAFPNDILQEAYDGDFRKTLEIVMADKVVLLNRQPTLHRLSIQAFEPVLVDGLATVDTQPTVPAFIRLVSDGFGKSDIG
jgi:DNA-directed RNA polymerase beta' subunit